MDGEGSSGRSQLHGQQQQEKKQQQQLHDSSKGPRRSLQSGGGATKQGAAARALWASGDGRAVGATVSASGGVAFHCTYDKNLESCTTRVPLAGGGVPECLSHVVDVSTGCARFLLLTSHKSTSSSSSSFSITDVSSGSTIATFTLRSPRAPNRHLILADGPLVAIPLASGAFSVLQLAMRHGGGYAWALHSSPPLPLSPLCSGSPRGDPALVGVLGVAKDGTSGGPVWRFTALSAPSAGMELHLGLPGELAAHATCATFLRGGDGGYAVGTAGGDVVVLSKGGSVERTICVSSMPAKVTCGCAHGIILVKTADSPPKLIAVAPGATGKGYAVLGRGEDALPIALGCIIPGGCITVAEDKDGETSLEERLSTAVVHRYEELLTPKEEGGVQGGEGGQQGGGLMRVRSALESKALECVRGAERAHSNLQGLEQLRNHVQSLLLEATLRDAQCPPRGRNELPLEGRSAIFGGNEPFMVTVRGPEPLPPPPLSKTRFSVPRTVDVVSWYEGGGSVGGRLVVEATVENPFDHEIEDVGLCIVANGLSSESNGGTGVAVPPRGSKRVAGVCRLLGEGGTPTSDVAYEVLISWRHPAGGSGGMGLVRPSIVGGGSSSRWGQKSPKMTWATSVLVKPQECMGGGQQIGGVCGGGGRKEGVMMCSCDVLVRAKRPGDLLPRGWDAPSMLSQAPGIRATSRGGVHEGVLRIEARDSASLSLAAAAVIRGLPGRAEGRVVWGWEKEGVREGVDAMIKELEFGVEAARGGGMGGEWLDLQARTDALIASLYEDV